MIAQNTCSNPYTIDLRSSKDINRMVVKSQGEFVFQMLIVEDSARFREMLTSLLVSEFPGVPISQAEDATAALHEIRARKPALIFMDIRLPGKNGLVLTKEIKGKYPGIVIVILSHLDASEYREAAVASGADYFLSKDSAKPGQIQDLVKTIMESVENRNC
jgi:DNA-binding NarL/FixJ family response regulator